MKGIHGVYDLRINPSFWSSIFTSKKSCASFTDRLSSVLGDKTVNAMDSGRTSLFIALRALGCQGRDVLVNAYTTDVVHKTIVAAGAKPVLFDIDPYTLEPNMDSLMKALSGKPAAAIHTGLFGFACNPSSFIQTLNSYGVPVIEDTCNSLGCSVGEKPSGTLSDCSIFSFRVGKPLSSGGGALVINNIDNLPKYQSILNHVQRTSFVASFFQLGRSFLDYLLLEPIILERIARPIRTKTRGLKIGQLLVKGGVVDTADIPDMNSIRYMGKFQCIFASIKLAEYSVQVERRKQACLELRSLLKSVSLLPVGTAEGKSWNGLFCPFLLPSDCADEFVLWCRKNKFDVSRFHYQAPTMLAEKYSTEKFPGTDLLCRRLVCLPAHITSSEIVDKLIDTVKGFMMSIEKSKD